MLKVKRRSGNDAKGLRVDIGKTKVMGKTKIESLAWWPRRYRASLVIKKDMLQNVGSVKGASRTRVRCAWYK